MTERIGTSAHPAIRLWSENDRIRLASMWTAGKSKAEIAQALGRSVGAIQTKAGELHLSGTRPNSAVGGAAAVKLALKASAAAASKRHGEPFLPRWHGNPSQPAPAAPGATRRVLEAIQWQNEIRLHRAKKRHGPWADMDEADRLAGIAMLEACWEAVRAKLAEG